ncbi:MAG: hypothetical protein ACRDRO_25995, partial [Pseudonocardiaceae bacterium]
MSTPNRRWYCFWRKYYGSLYGLRVYHPTTGRLVFGYGGKTFQTWTTRIEQHLWGGGRYGSVPKPFADTVPGWRPNGTVEEVIAAGGAFRIYQGRVSPWGLWWREILFAIWLRAPLYNHMLNQANPRRIPISVQYRQREARDRGEAYSGVGRIGRAHLAWLSAHRTVTVALATVAVVALLGVALVSGFLTTAATGVGDAAGAGVDGVVWAATHRHAVGSGLVIGGGVWFLTTLKPRRRRRSPSRSSR